MNNSLDRCSRRRFCAAGVALAAAGAVGLAGSRRAGGTGQPETITYPDGYQTLLSGKRLGIIRRPPAATWRREPLTELPHYDPASTTPFQIDLRQCDVSALDLTDRLDDLLHADFDSGTSWPRRLPAGFAPDAILATGRNPGLHMRDLHRRGITGDGVGIAIIDQTLLVDHVEYRDRLRSYEEIHNLPEMEAQMHGPAVASIAVGHSTGVAPGADLYYIAETHGLYGGGSLTVDLSWLATSIDRILEINRRLPRSRRIRVISCSVGWSWNNPGYDEVTAAVQRATDAGVFVLSTSLEATHGLSFHGLGRDPRTDPDLATSYGLGSWWAEAFLSGQYQFAPGIRLLAPMDARTTASPHGTCDYVFYSSGGWSWTVPYLAGLYTLACQVAPDVTPERFWAAGLATGVVVPIADGTTTIDLGTVVQPTALIAELTDRKSAVWK